MGDYYHILVLSSPTGFSKKAKEFVESNDYLVGFASKYVTIYLIDPVKGELYYNKRDTTAEANKFLAEPRLPEEIVNKVIEYVLSREAKEKAVINSPSSPFLTVGDIESGSGVSEKEIILRALAELEKRGAGKIMMTDTGLKAFFYHSV
jgi:hypothetical protein